MEFRFMKNTDVLEIYKLGKKDFAKKDEYSWDWSIKEIKKFLEKSNLGIICKDRKIVGFILVGKNYSSQKPKTAWLRYVFVDKKHRREKIASKLLDYAIRKLKELGKKDLEADVYTKNNSSIKFFKSHGFKTEESYYIMVRKIK